MKRQARKHYSLPLSPHILLKIPPKDEEGRDDAQWWCNFPQGGSPIIFYFPCLLSVSRIEFSACRGRQDTRQAGKNTGWTIKCPGVPLPSLSHLSLSLNLVLFWEQSIICPCEMLGSSFFSLYFFPPLWFLLWKSTPSPCRILLLSRHALPLLNLSTFL